MTDPVTADGPSFGVDEAVERLRLSREQYGLLGLLLGLVVVIALVSYQSSRDVGQQTASLSEYLQTVSGDRVSLERQVVIFALEVERWRNDELTSEELELSFGLVERQRRVAQDEAEINPRLASQLEGLSADIAAVRAAMESGAPERGSAADTELTETLDRMVLVVGRIFDESEATNFELLHDLEDGLSAARRTEQLVVALVVVLFGLLLWAMRRMLTGNYAEASEALAREQRRYVAARADQARAEELSKIQTEVLELVATDRPQDEVFDRIVDRTAAFLDGIDLRFRPAAEVADHERAGAISMHARESKAVVGELEWTVGADADIPADFDAILAFAGSLGALAIDRQRAAEELAHQATHDSLTGLPNRAYFADRVRWALHRARKDGTRLAVLFIDLDRFKVVNDSFGHDAGDQVLLHAASVLTNGVRANDIVARFAGDEFVVLIEEAADLDQLHETAARLQTALAAPVDVDGTSVRMGASIGIAEGDGDTTVEELLRHADLAMYRAKEDGRGGYELFDEDMRAWNEERQATELALRQAFERGEFEAHYQPLVDTATLKIVGFEALARWNRPGMGVVGPGAFIDLAEELGLIAPLGRFMLSEAARQVSAWRELDPDITVSVNVSGRELADEDFSRFVHQTLRAHDTEPSSIVLEITESVLLEDANEIGQRLSQLRDLGVHVAIDDFGTGYSSLRYLRELPVDSLKIDRVFVSGTDGAEVADPAIVASVIDLGHALGLRVTAEGVETPAQLDALKTLGADVCQGYLFGRPVDVDAAFGLLRADIGDRIRER